MITKEVNGHKVLFYDTGENMTMKRYQRFNKYIMIDNEVGSDFNDFNNRLGKAVQYLKKGMQDEGVAELENWRQMVYNAYTEYSPKNMALALIVHSIDGEEFKDITASGLEAVIRKLDDIGFTKGLTESTIDEVKKK